MLEMQSGSVYPFSRVQLPTWCKTCKTRDPGEMVPAGRVFFDDDHRNRVSLMRLSCNKCGHTLLFDDSGPKAQPLQGETFPT